MAQTYKVVAQSAPAATTNTDVLTVGAGKSVVASTITICNRGATDAQYRIAVRSGGATLANQHYIAFNTTVAANDTIALTIGMTLAANDV
ncbi:MAG: hypothetical protein EB023_11870, partial [Flavobacteriia bacterium]|nr:hypothetical protein [Flavobacteriia bacterium]